MSDHAGFAAAITIRDQVLNDTFLNFYHAGTLSHSLSQTFGEGGLFPRGSVNLFLQSPRVIFSNTDHQNGILRLRGWGTIAIRPSQFPVNTERRDIQWQAELRFTPQTIVAGKLIVITAKAEDFQLLSWQFDVLSGTAFSTTAHNYLTGGVFKDLLTTWLRALIGDLVFPIDFSSLGPLGTTSFLDAAIRLVDGSLILGLNIDNGVVATQGAPGELRDFARDNQIAFVINPVVIPTMMQDAETLVRDTVAAEGATLESFEITAEEGRFRVRGRASTTGGAANFSLAVLPLMSYTRPGAYVWTSTGRVPVKSRTWPALSFVPAEVSVDIDRSWWVVLIELVGTVLTLGFIPFAVEVSIREIIRNITGGIETSNVNTQEPLALVRRIPPLASGGATTRIKIEQFEIHTDGLFVGLTSRLETKAPVVSGLKSLPRNFANHTIRYDVSLPFEAQPGDPFLRVRWTVVNMDTGHILLNLDEAALNRLSIEFVPAALGDITNRFTVICRVYRMLGPFATELLNETIRLDVGFPLEPGTYVRWRYEVLNPQILLNPEFALDPTVETYLYHGDARVRRWSKIHRRDKPCKSVKHPSHWLTDSESLDELPFPIRALSDHRYQLCDYCFFGGPGSVRSSL